VTAILNTKHLLARQKSVMLERLAALATSGRSDRRAAYYRKKANEILQEFIIADCALESISLLETGDVAEKERPIDAILAFLDKSERSILKDTLIEGVVSGGFREGDPKVKIMVHKSIDNHLNGTGAKKQLIKSVNGRIGKWAWDDAMF
jgi:hypothetical protein